MVLRRAQHANTRYRQQWEKQETPKTTGRDGSTCSEDGPEAHFFSNKGSISPKGRLVSFSIFDLDVELITQYKTHDTIDCQFLHNCKQLLTLADSKRQSFQPDHKCAHSCMLRMIFFLGEINLALENGQLKCKRYSYKRLKRMPPGFDKKGQEKKHPVQRTSPSTGERGTDGYTRGGNDAFDDNANVAK